VEGTTVELNDLLKGLMGELEKISSSESVVGKPLKFGDAALVPLCRVSLGFGTGTTDLSGSASKRDGSIEGGGAGGGLTVEPRAFVVVASDGVPHLLAMHKGSATLQHPLELQLTPPAATTSNPGHKLNPKK
jgi:uncharacterized spore protein YtfJ